MKTITLNLDLPKAKEYYNSGNEELKKIALQAYDESELVLPDYSDIKDFWDAVEVLGLDRSRVQSNINNLEVIDKHLVSVYKLGIIRKALNGEDWIPKMTEEILFTSYVRVYRGAEKIDEDEETIIGKFRSSGACFIVTGGLSRCQEEDECGLISLSIDNGYSDSEVGLIGCRSQEIADYMSLQFGKLIFDVCYSQYIGSYEWL